MDIQVGRTGRIPTDGAKKPGPQRQLEARVLAVRPPRRRVAGPPGHLTERRGKPQPPDPRGSRVLILMIPDANQLPPDLEGGDFRVFLRFARR